MDEIETTMAIKSAAQNAGNIQDMATRNLFLELLAIVDGLQTQILDMQPSEDEDE